MVNLTLWRGGEEVGGFCGGGLLAGLGAFGGVGLYEGVH